MQVKLFAQLMSAEKIEEIISCKLNKKKKNDMSFVMKVKYDQMLKDDMSFVMKVKYDQMLKNVMT